jgi:hypothetical protein
MGLFSKKPKPTADAGTEDDAASALAAPVAAPPAPLPAPRPAKKNKKATIDPVDFLNLRAELMDVKARLMAAEQSRAIVESRLAALDATALALSSDQAVASGAAERLADLEARVADLADLGEPHADTATTPADDTAAREMAAALQARIDELAGRVDAKGDDAELLAKIDALEAQVVEAVAVSETVRAEAAARADAPTPTPLLAPTPTPVTDPEVLARLDALGIRVQEIDELAIRVAHIDVLTGQLSQLNARVTAQAEFGAQLSSMRDRITELQNDTEARRDAAQVANDDAELRDRVNGLTDRLVATEALSVQLGLLAERVAATDATARQAGEQVAALEQRVDSVGTELANQISELGRDIDGLAERTADVASGTVSDEVMAALRGGQIKLANEQARYEIAFREDLAALAEHVRRQPRT